MKNIITLFISGGDKISFEDLLGDVQASIKKVKGVEAIYIDEERLQESWQFSLNKKALLRYNLDSGRLIEQIREAVGPQELGRIRLRGCGS